MHSHVEPASTPTDNLSPIRTNTKAERYSGTPHHSSPTKLKVIPHHNYIIPTTPTGITDVSTPAGKILRTPIKVNFSAAAATGAQHIILVKTKPARADSYSISSKSSSNDLIQNKQNSSNNLFDSNKQAFS